jgi:hypothetical protein
MRTRSLLLSVAAVGLLGAGVGRAEVFNEYDPRAAVFIGRSVNP